MDFESDIERLADADIAKADAEASVLADKLNKGERVFDAMYISVATRQANADPWRMYREQKKNGLEAAAALKKVREYFRSELDEGIECEIADSSPVVAEFYRHLFGSVSRFLRMTDFIEK